MNLNNVYAINQMQFIEVIDRYNGKENKISLQAIDIINQITVQHNKLNNKDSYQIEYGSTTISLTLTIV